MSKYVFFLTMILVLALSLPVATTAQDKSKRTKRMTEIVSPNRDAMISDMNNLVADAYQYRIRPDSVGGGQGSYKGYKIQEAGAWGKQNPNAVYKVIKADDKGITFEGKSLVVKGAKITLTANGNGMVEPIVFKGFK